MVSTVQPTTVYPHHDYQQNDSSSTERHNDKDRDNDRDSDSDEQSSGGDTCSVTSETQKENNNDGALVLRGEDVSDLTTATRGTTFGTVAVTNSTDVHFGNKTYYQGPVTIKQILYANHNDSKIIGQDDLTVDGVIISNGTAESKDKRVILDPEELGEENKNDRREETSNKFVQKCHQWLPNVSRNRVLAIGFVAMTLMVVITLTAVLLVKNMADKNEGGYPVDSTEQDTGTPITGPNVNTTLPGKLKIISRLEWVAQPPTEPANALPVPASYAILMHTATENCTDQPTCVFHVRYIQSYHMDSRGWWDIGYNFLVGGDGNAYEGRGWKSEGAHTYGYNAQSIGIAFIGTFNKYMPPNRQIIACKQLLQKGVELGYLKKDYKLLAARQVSTTQSPGDILYENIKTWPHWSEKP